MAIRAVAARPWITLAAVLAATLLFGGGLTLRVPQAETGTVTFLPSDSDVARAADTIDELFGGSSDAVVTTVIFRGNALSPAGLAQMDELLDRIAVEPGVAGTLTPSHAIVAPTSVIGGVLGTGGFERVTQAEINSAIERMLTDPGLVRPQTALLEMTGTDRDGTLISVATIRLRDTGDDLARQAQLKIHDLAETSQGPLLVGTVSPALIEQVYQEATGPGFVPLMALAVLVVSALMLLFMRSGLDLLLTLVGLGLALTWTLGAEGWLGPGALDLIGPPNAFGAMVPIILIGLAVDYVIQSLSRYREYRISGEPVAEAMRGGLRKVITPVALAAGTTMVSLLSNLLSPVAPIGDFGVVAAVGVGLSFVVMLTFVPAVRTIIDRRREERGALPPARPISDSLPGVGWAGRLLGMASVRWPVPLLAVLAAATVGFGFAAASVTTDFSHRDLLPSGGDLNRDLDTLRAAVGGSTEVVDVLVKAEITEPRTLFNLVDLTTAFDDNLRRPRGAVSGIQTSPGIVVVDWITDDGTPGDRYDPELEALFNRATARLQVDRELVQEFVVRMKEREPDELARVLAEDPHGVDTMLLQFQAFTGDQQRTRWMQEDIEGLWFGGDEEITVTSSEIRYVVVNDEIRETQTQTTVMTIVAALAILMLFFRITMRQSVLGVIAVAPVVVSLIWMLGTMGLLGIPYTITTSAVIALVIGVGVDYTIHIIYRYQEEYSQARDPEEAMGRTLSTTGSALMGSALTTALGMGVLALSDLVVFRNFGLMVALALIYSLIVSTFLLPPTMSVWAAYQNMRMRYRARRLSDDADLKADHAHRGSRQGQGVRLDVNPGLGS
ncbi:MAG: MMPL family transporter [bacterium]|nr:MMPL family transporter [bacterium]